MTARGRLETELIETTIEEIERDAQRIYDAGISLYMFLLRNGLEPALPPGARPRGHKSKTARKQRRKAMGK